MSYIVGLTGGIASGKTTASHFFINNNIDVIDADIIAREVSVQGSPALKKIHQHFGDSILLDDRSLNRERLRSVIFTQPTQKKWLENLLHPLIRQKITVKINQSTTPYCVFVSPLLLETDQYRLVNQILVIDTPVEMQIERVMRRDNCDEEAAKAIINTQISREDRISKTKDIVLNSTSFDELNQKLKYFHEKYMKLAKSYSDKS